MNPLYLNNKDFIKQLLNDYQRSYNHIKDTFNFSEAYRYLFKSNMQYGICYYAEKTYERVIANKTWVTKHLKSDSIYWCSTPKTAKTTTSLKKAIETRINILKVVLEEL